MPKPKKHKYQGGSIVPSTTPVHYHVDYWLNWDGAKLHGLYMDGYIIDVNKKFEIFDTVTQQVIAKATSLKDAVMICFEKYKQKHPKDKIDPVWGAGAPNDVLEELGFKR